MLNNQFKKQYVEKEKLLTYLLQGGTICFFVQGNVKKSKNVTKINENSYYWQRKSSYLLKNLSNFSAIFKIGVTYETIKSHKTSGLCAPSRPPLPPQPLVSLLIVLSEWNMSPYSFFLYWLPQCALYFTRTVKIKLNCFLSISNILEKYFILSSR